MGDFLSRYRGGQFQEVWREFSKLPMADDALRLEAEAVADETMKRVARNADIVAQQLANAGWEALTGELRNAPEADDQKFIASVEALTGAPIPISLASFWKIVGGIDFVWNYEVDRYPPDLCESVDLVEADPLYISPVRHSLYHLELWFEQPPDRAAGEPWFLDLAPDYLHKANISGGAAYGAELPVHWADFTFANERHNLKFIDYLRLAFRWGGFPGLDEKTGADVNAFVKAMTIDLEPF